MKLVLIEFTDITAYSEWRCHEEIKAEACPCAIISAIGWLVYEDKKVVKLSAMLDTTKEDNQYFQLLVIPRGAITSRKELKIGNIRNK